MISKQQKLIICLEKGGLQNASAIVQASSLERFDLAELAAIIEEESGGRNIYGADDTGPDGALPPALYDKPVTKANFKTFWARVQAGHTSNGVGLAQLTSKGFLEAANSRGGAWIPIHQCTEACAILRGLIADHATFQAAAAAYNGAGPVADAYGARVQALAGAWQQRINSTLA